MTEASSLLFPFSLVRCCTKIYIFVLSVNIMFSGNQSTARRILWICSETLWMQKRWAVTKGIMIDAVIGKLIADNHNDAPRSDAFVYVIGVCRIKYSKSIHSNLWCTTSCILISKHHHIMSRHTNQNPDATVVRTCTCIYSPVFDMHVFVYMYP